MTARYTDALNSLQNAEAECKKPTQIDLDTLLLYHHNCMDNLRLIEEDNPIRKAAVEELMKILSHHCSILMAKIEHLQHEVKDGSEASINAMELKGSNSAITLDQKNKLPQDKPYHQVQQVNQTEHGKEQQIRSSVIEATILDRGKLGFTDIAGLETAKQALIEAIIIPIQFPHFFKGSCQPWKRILLYGPPGTGKSRLAQAVSSEIKSTFYSVSSADLLSSYFGESEKLIKELFRHAHSQPGRSVIFIDEIDSVCRRRSSQEQENTRRIKTELLRQMEGASSNVNQENSQDIFLLCATNCPWELDPAFLRRFQKRIYIPLPNREARKAVLTMHIKGNDVQLSNSDWQQLMDQTEGMSGSDLATLTLDVLFEPIRELQTSNFWKTNTDGKIETCTKNHPGAYKSTLGDLPQKQVIIRPVVILDFLKLLSRHKQTVEKSDLEKYEDFTKAYGQIG